MYNILAHRLQWYLKETRTIQVHVLLRTKHSFSFTAYLHPIWFGSGGMISLAAHKQSFLVA